MSQKIRTIAGISLFWVALSMLFDGINTLVLPGRLLQLQGEARSATWVGLVTFFGLTAAMLVQPYAGAWSDRLQPWWGRKGVIGLGLLLLLFSLALFGLGQNLIVVVLGYLFIQLAASVAQAGQQGFIPDLVAPENRGAASGLKGFMDIGGALLGFVLLGRLLGEGGVWPALLALAVALLLCYALTVIMVREPRSRAVAITEPHPAPISFLGAFRLDLKRHRNFAWLVLARFLFLLGTYAIGRFLLLFVANRLGLDATAAAEQAGYLLAALALITVLAALPAGWAADRIGRMPLMRLGAALSALGALLMVGAGSGGQILAFGALLSLGNAAFLGANWALTADLVPQQQAARFFGLANVGTGGAAAAAGLFGPLVDGVNSLSPTAGYTALFVAAALTFAGSALALARIQLAQPWQPSPAGIASGPTAQASTD